MKRSEMIQIIRSSLSDMSVEVSALAAQILLQDIEVAGMLPPQYRLSAQWGSYHYSSNVDNDDLWEKE